jgi:hypothetical protein
VTFDPDRIVDRILEIFVAERNNWLTFRQLASRITGNPSDEPLIAGVVHRHDKVFVVHADCRCKLRAEFIEASAGVEHPPKAPSEPIYLQAARAVREYARQLRPLHIKVIGSDKGKRVLDRFLHALQVDLLDDDIRFSDDTPVELLSAQRSRNPGHVAVSRPALMTSSSSLRMTLCPTAVTPTFFPWLTSWQIMRAPVKVLPAPGGP